MNDERKVNGTINTNDTSVIETQPFNNEEVRDILNVVYNALKEKGYDPIRQISGYITSGDPSYITSYKGARALIDKVARYEILEVVLGDYLGVK